MWTAELQLGIESWWGFRAWSCSGGYPVRRPSGLRPPAGTAAPRTAELQLGIESWWGFRAWSCSGGTRYTGLLGCGRPPGPQRPGPPSSSSALSRGGDFVRGRVPGVPGTPAFWVDATSRCRRPSVARAAWSCVKRRGGDHAARASDGLLPCFIDAPWMRSPWIAKHAHCAHRASGREVDEGHNGVHGVRRAKLGEGGRDDMR